MLVQAHSTGASFYLLGERADLYVTANQPILTSGHSNIVVGAPTPPVGQRGFTDLLLPPNVVFPRVAFVIEPRKPGARSLMQLD